MTERPVNENRKDRGLSADSLITETICLSDADRNLFHDLISNPPSPNEALRKLMKLDDKIQA